MPQPSFASEAQIEKDGREDAAGNEERFQALGSNVGYIRYALAGRHGGVVRGAFGFPGDYHGEEHAW